MTTDMTTDMTDMTTVDPATRNVPRYGGLNTTILRIELRRMLRNRRTLFFTMIFPAGLFFAFGGNSDWDDRAGYGNVAAYVMVSMAFYGAALTAATSGATVAMERALGWSRQLRLTPLSPVVHITLKALVALVMGAVAVAVVNAAGIVQGKPDLALGRWVACAVLAVLCTLVFASLGVFVGYLLPGENAMQILGPGLALMAFLGNVFIPIHDHTSLLWHIAQWTPMFGVAEITRWPLTGDLQWYAVVNAFGWLAVFILGAAWRMSKDTARV
jgi:ABC-2 type transport system permease protein